VIDRDALADTDTELFEHIEPRPAVVPLTDDFFFWCLHFSGDLAREISVTEPQAREPALSVKSGSAFPPSILMTIPENGQDWERCKPGKALELLFPFAVRNFQRSSGFSVAMIQL
jgi:hypothetical protein